MLRGASPQAMMPVSGWGGAKAVPDLSDFGICGEAWQEHLDLWNLIQ